MTSNPLGFSEQGDGNLNCVMMFYQIFEQKVLFPRVKISEI